jgi:hypothetical protein
MPYIQNIHHSEMTLEDLEQQIISLSYHLEGDGTYDGDEKRAAIRRLQQRRAAIQGRG